MLEIANKCPVHRTLVRHRSRSFRRSTDCARDPAGGRYSRVAESIQSVTGPSLIKATCMCAPNTPVGDGAPELALQRGDESVEQGPRDFRRRRGAVGRAGALFRRRMERELTDGEDLAADVAHRAVHDAGVVVEDAQGDDLVRQPVGFGDGIRRRDAAQNEEARRRWRPRRGRRPSPLASRTRWIAARIGQRTILRSTLATRPPTMVDVVMVSGSPAQEGTTSACHPCACLRPAAARPPRACRSVEGLPTRTCRCG